MKHPNVRVSGLAGENVYAVIGGVKSALRSAGFAVEAVEFADQAILCESYEAVLELCRETVCFS